MSGKSRQFAVDEALRQRIAVVAGEFDLNLVVLFGSHVNGRAVKRSDIDLAVAYAGRSGNGACAVDDDEKDFRLIYERLDDQIVFRTAQRLVDEASAYIQSVLAYLTEAEEADETE